ncbi:MAG: hypothetical protein R3C10_19055 [Pirellulales bacterium]
MTPRRGMTLYEIVLSLAILFGSMAVMAGMIATGSRAATQSRLRTKAAILCQTKLAEIVAGAEPMTATSGGSLADPATSGDVLAGWSWDLGVTQGDLRTDLVRLEVTVRHSGENGESDAASTLIRYVRSPAVYEAAAQLEAENSAEEQGVE